MEQEKRRFRRFKRDLKRAGNRQRRRHLQRELLEDPNAAGSEVFEFGRRSTAGLNGNDRDSTRRPREDD